MKQYSRTRNSFQNMATGLLGQILSISLNFLCRTAFIHALGVSYLGINGLFSDILSMLSLAELGIDMSITYRLYKPVSDNDIHQIRRYLGFLRSIYRIIALIIFVLGVFLIPFLHIFIADYNKLASLGINAGFVFVLYLLQTVSTYAFYAYRSIALRVNQKQYLINETGLIITILSNIVNIFLLLHFRSFICYMISLTFFGVLSNMINAFVATRCFPEYFAKEETKLSRNDVIKVFKDCGALFFYKINNVVMNATNNIVLSSFIGLTIVGLYSNYLLVYNVFIKVFQMIYTSVEASMGNLFASNDLEKKYFFFEIMNFVSLILYGFAAIFITIESNEFISVWIGNDYTIPQPFPLLMGIEILFTGLKMNLAQIRHISGVFRQMWYRPFWGSLINLSVSIILVKPLGIHGVIIGTLSAAIFANLAIDPVIIHKYTFDGAKNVIHYYRKNITFIIVLFVIGLICKALCELLFVGWGFWSFIIHSLLCLILVPSLIIGIFWKNDSCIYLRSKTLSLICVMIKRIR